jgi:cell division protein ZapA (FtsZ GTPase activity inhibitor)
MSGPGQKTPSPDEGPAQSPPSQVVEVAVLGRPYQIRGDRPELIAWISQLINEQAATIRRLSPNADLSDLDILVRVAFRLGLSLYQGVKELETFKNSAQAAETRIESLSKAIDEFLPPK